MICRGSLRRARPQLGCRHAARQARKARLQFESPAHSSSGLGHRPLTAAARVRIPYAPLSHSRPSGFRMATRVRSATEGRNAQTVPPPVPPSEIAQRDNNSGRGPKAAALPTPPEAPRALGPHARPRDRRRLVARSAMAVFGVPNLIGARKQRVSADYGIGGSIVTGQPLASQASATATMSKARSETSSCTCSSPS
jgi:hypothetical protein